jgi:hypothetical protein
MHKKLNLLCILSPICIEKRGLYVLLGRMHKNRHFLSPTLRILEQDQQLMLPKWRYFKPKALVIAL